MKISKLGHFDSARERRSEKLVLSRSLWTATKEETVEPKILTGREETEVIIIGGGYTGLSAAIHLHERGHVAVLLEAGEIGYGGSGRNAGHFNPGWKTDPEDILARYGRRRGERIVRMADKTCDLVFDIIHRYGIRCDLARNGYVQGAIGRHDLKIVHKKARQWMDRRAPVEVLNKSRISEIIGSDYYIGGQLDLRGGSLQPLSYVCGLARVAMELGVKVYAHSPALKISRKTNDWVVKTPKGTVRAKFLLIGTNGYTGKLWPKLDRTLVPVPTFMTATAPLPDAMRRQILPQRNNVSETRRIPFAFQITKKGQFAVGGRGNTFDRAQSGDTQHIRKVAIQIYPQLADVKWEYDWGGLVAMTMNREPRIFKLGPDAYAGLAYNGRGVPMATMMGKQLAALVCGEDIPMPVETVKPIRFHRFAQIGISWHILVGRLLDGIL